ncbi:ATP-binding protein [Alteromonas sp. KUL49]|uniref:ATP-binding protein n=1 Tax=Alteromonas sp. KUL49 TaxID=2480798 RepID=UPI00102F2154|nr:ATP-binding protein [Alteromonas sp. KUL49]TAP35506.1 sensor histidine kinase [Alteromonas sp. KUL49]
MFRWLLLLMCISLLCDELMAQQAIPPESEEVRSQILDSSLSNSKRLATIIEFIKTHRRSDPDTSLEYADLGFELLKITADPSLESQLVGYMTKIYLERGELNRAESLIKHGLSAADRANSPQGLAINLFNQALLYQLDNKLVLALDSYNELKRAYIATKDISGLAAAHNNMGIIYQNLGNLEDALSHFQQALPYYTESGSKVHEANTIMNIGELLYLIGDVKQAEQNYQQGLSLITRDSAPLSFLEGHLRLAILYGDQQALSLASEHLSLATSVAKEYDLIASLLSINYEEIKLLSKQGDADKAYAVLLNVEELLRDDVQPELALGAFYFRALVAVEQKRWSDAERYIDALFENHVYDFRFFELQDALSLAFLIKRQLGKDAQANAIISEWFSRYRDHQKDNRDALIAQYAQLYKVNEAEREVEALTQQAIENENEKLRSQQQTRQVVFIFVVVSVVLSACLLLIWQRGKALKRENSLTNELITQKKRFFADISHELRTPLTVFKLKMQELEYNIADDPKRIYKLLNERIDSFNSLINDISLLAQNDKGEIELHFEHVNLREFFERRGDELSSLAAENGLNAIVDIRLTNADEGIIDAARVRQVLANLFSNACRYTHAPGKVRFKVKLSESRLYFRVEDSAPGLSIYEQRRVFDPLYRVDKSRSRKLGGSGLGLSICNDLIKAQNGTISIDNSELGGVMLSVVLPRNGGNT